MFFKKKPIEKEMAGGVIDTTSTVDDVIDTGSVTMDDILDETEPYYELPKGNVVLNRVMFRSEHYILIELDPDERCIALENIVIHTNTIKSATVSVYTDSAVTYDDFVCTTFNSPLPKPTVLYRKYVSNRHVFCILTGDEIDAVRISFRPTYVKDELRRKERYFRRYLFP